MENTDFSGLVCIFNKPTIDIARFVRHVASGGSEIAEDMLQKLSYLSEDVSAELKKVIFDNYQLFIATGKAATQLEATMHLIHGDFAEKQRVLNALAEISLLDETVPELNPQSLSRPRTKGNDDSSRASEFAGSSVEGLLEILDNVGELASKPDRQVIFDGELRELCVDSMTLICVARLFLMDDVLVVAYAQPSRAQTTCMYTVQSIYPLDRIHVVALSDRNRRRAATNSFKIVANTDSRVFQADTNAVVQVWIKQLEDTRRQFVAAGLNKARRAGIVPTDPTSGTRGSLLIKDSRTNKGDADGRVQAKPAAESSDVPLSSAYAIAPENASHQTVEQAQRALSATLPDCADLLSQVIGNPSPVDYSRKNPFYDDVKKAPPPSASLFDKTCATRLWDVPDDLDVAISERDFSKATDLIVEGREKLDQMLKIGTSSTVRNEDRLIEGKPTSSWLALYKQIKENESVLVEALEYELVTSAERHGAPRSVAAIVLYLSRLGKVILAAHSFLVYRSNTLSKATTTIRQEGNQLIYLNRLSFTFHRQLIETALEWRQSVFNPLKNLHWNDFEKWTTIQQMLFTCFASWVSEETAKFAHQLHVLLGDLRSLSYLNMVMAIQRTMAHAKKVSELLNVDVESMLRADLLRTCKMAAESQTRVIRDAVTHRARQRYWELVSTKSPQEQEQCQKDMRDMGLLRRDISISQLPLTIETCQLARSLHSFLQCAYRLDCPELNEVHSQSLAQILHAELEHYKAALADKQLESKKSEIVYNMEFLSRKAVPKLCKGTDYLYYQDMADVMAQFEVLGVRKRKQKQTT